MSEYVLQVGADGFDRLEFLNSIFGEHSRNFLTRARLGEGHSVLELGCGAGSMTAWLASVVGRSGRVIAVDASEDQIEIARSVVKTAGFANVEFLCSTVEGLDLPKNSVDLVYSS